MDAKLQRLHETLREAIRGMSSESLSRKRQGQWCSAEILEHLNLTYTGTIKNLERRLSTGTPVTDGDRHSKRLQRFFVTRLGYFPRGRKSPERVRPRGLPCEQVISEVFGNIEAMDRLIAECESRFGKRLPIAEHPVLGPLTAAEWRGFHLTHGKHHARQIARLRDSA